MRIVEGKFQQHFVDDIHNKYYMKGVNALGENLTISLAAARVNAGMTQDEVANAVHVSKNTIVAWENGKQQPKVDMARALSNLYGMPLDNIRFGE